MKDSTKYNIYEFNALSVLELYGAFIEGDASTMAVAVSAAPASPATRNAIESSLARLDIGGTCAWVVLERDGATLGPADLWNVVEGLDPTTQIALDAESAAELADAYRCAVPTDAALRLFGRTALAFRDFPAMLQTDEGKQKAWALLKKLKQS